MVFTAVFMEKSGCILEANGFNNKRYRYYDGYIRLINDKFCVRDSEILIAGNNLEIIKKSIVKKLHINCKMAITDCEKIVEIIFNQKICIPTEKELSSFFYGQAFINTTFSKNGNYKINGKNLYNDFKKKNYKFCYLFADATELCFDYEKIFKMINNDATELFGCGLLMIGLSNNFASDNSNIFLDDFNDFYIKNNTWD